MALWAEYFRAITLGNHTGYRLSNGVKVDVNKENIELVTIFYLAILAKYKLKNTPYIYDNFKINSRPAKDNEKAHYEISWDEFEIKYWEFMFFKFPYIQKVRSEKVVMNI